MIIIIALSLGAIVGSFLNVCIYRIPREISIVRPGSFCPQCSKPVRFFHNIPVVSYLILKGKCSSCSAPISWRYPAVEILTALVTSATLGHFGFSLDGSAFLIFFYLLIVIAFIDLEHFIIPDSLLLLCLGAWCLLIFKDPSWLTLYEALLGSVVFGGFLYLAGQLGILVFKKESLGFGDVKLGFVLGMFLGWQLVVVSLYGAFFLAALVAAAGFITRRVKFGQMIPFGPFLILGCVGAVFLGERIIELFILWMLT